MRLQGLEHQAGELIWCSETVDAVVLLHLGTEGREVRGIASAVNPIGQPGLLAIDRERQPRLIVAARLLVFQVGD